MKNISKQMYWISVLFIGLLGCVVFHSVDILSGFTHMSGERRDPFFVAFILEHTLSALRGDVAWGSPIMFYPHENTLGYSDALLAYWPIYWFFRFWTSEPITGLQYAAISHSFINYLSSYLLLRRGLMASRILSVVGAMLLAFNSVESNQLWHYQLLPSVFLIGMVFCILKFYQDIAGGKALLLLGIFLVLLSCQLLTCFCLAWFFCFHVTLFLVVSLLFHASRRYLIEILLRHKTIIALLSLFFCLISIPFITIYLPAYKEVGQYSFTEASAMIPRPVSYLLMGDGNYWWRALQRFAGALPHCWEHNIGFGFILSGLWILFSLQTLFKSSQERSQAFVSALVISTNIVILLALDYNGWSPWRYVYEYVPGAKSIRSVSRISLITIGVIIVTLVASTVKLGASQTVFSKWQSRFFFALLSLACVEQIGEANSFDKSKISTELESAAGRVSKDCLAFYVINGITPQDQIWDMQAWAIYVAALTKIPTLNGYSGQFPPQWNLLDVNSSNYQVEVGNWVVRHNLTGKICSLGIQ